MKCDNCGATHNANGDKIQYLINHRCRKCNDIISGLLLKSNNTISATIVKRKRGIRRRSPIKKKNKRIPTEVYLIKKGDQYKLSIGGFPARQWGCEKEAKRYVRLIIAQRVANEHGAVLLTETPKEKHGH